jgi:hypothetical protein
MSDVSGQTSTSPMQPTNVCRISADIALELSMLIMGVPCAMYTIITEM